MSAPRFAGTTVVVTGSNSGVGLAAAIGFARQGARVALTGRDEARLAEARHLVAAVADPEAPPVAYRCDFGVLNDVRELAGRLAETYPRIDVLCNNAGAVLARRVTTVDGFELTMQANHLAPFLLTNLLRERLCGGRVVNTASFAHRVGRLNPADLNGERSPYFAFAVYAATKQANILFTAEAARRWPEIGVYSYHPGAVRSRFARASAVADIVYRHAPFTVSPEQGADTMVWLAGAPSDRLRDGGYYTRRKLSRPGARATDPHLAARLWRATATAVALPDEA